mgnify:CR=1 FL=1
MLFLFIQLLEVVALESYTTMLALPRIYSSPLDDKDMIKHLP